MRKAIRVKQLLLAVFSRPLRQLHALRYDLFRLIICT